MTPSSCTCTMDDVSTHYTTLHWPAYTLGCSTEQRGKRHACVIASQRHSMPLPCGPARTSIQHVCMSTASHTGTAPLLAERASRAVPPMHPIEGCPLLPSAVLCCALLLCTPRRVESGIDHFHGTELRSHSTVSDMSWQQQLYSNSHTHIHSLTNKQHHSTTAPPAC